MKKDNLKSVIVLSAICLVVAIALAAVNFITKPVIEKNNDEKLQASLKAVLPEAEDFSEITLPDDAPDTVTAVYKDSGNIGYAVAISTSSSYSKNPMTFTVGIDCDGKVLAVEMTNYSETKNFGDAYPKTYIGADSETVEDIDLFAGVTYSSTAFREAMTDALIVLNTLGEVN